MCKLARNACKISRMLDWEFKQLNLTDILVVLIKDSFNYTGNIDV